MLKIALAHLEGGARQVFDERGRKALQHNGEKCLIGLFIPASTYNATNIGRLTIYEMRQAGFIDHDELSFFKEMDKMNILGAPEWLEAIQEKIDEGNESSNG